MNRYGFVSMTCLGCRVPMASKSLRLLAVISVTLHLSPSPMAITVSRACRAVCTGSLSFASLMESIMVNHSMSATNLTVSATSGSTRRGTS